MSLLSENVGTVVSTSNIVVQTPTPPFNSARVVSAVYNYHVLGGSLGTYNLPLNMSLPQGAVLQSIVCQQLEPVTSAAPYTVSFGINAPGDAQTLVIFTNPPNVVNDLYQRANTTVNTLKLTIVDSPLTGGVVLFKILYL